VELFQAPPVEFGDNQNESAALRGPAIVKLFAKIAGANKPRHPPDY
jgi:hypothetical protein